MTSPFRYRGVIEGFYGRPWTHDQRLDMIEFLADHGLNTFVYAPKDDPFLRERWREPYSGDRLDLLADLLARARSRGVDLVPCLAPGLSVQYSSAEDRDTLVAKLADTLDLGVTGIGLLLDDIPWRLQHPADREAYPSLAAAQVDLVTAVHAALPAGTTVFVCPTEYWGRGDEEYLATLGRGLDPRIEVTWTGRQICSPTIDLADAAVVTRTLNRPVTYWDNYPVNDVAMTHELHIGPYRGRDPDLARFATGVLANAMEAFESSKVAIATVADYLRDPHGYDPEASWRRAIDEVAGDHAASYLAFADNCRSSVLSELDAPRLTEALENFLFEVEYADADAARATFLGVVAELADAADDLRRGAAAGVPLLVEAAPWLETFALGTQALAMVPDAVAGRGLEELRALHTRIRDTRRRVFGDLLDMTITDLTSTDLTGPADPG